MPCLLKNARLWPYAVFWWHPRQFCRASGSEKSEKSERSDHEHLCSIGDGELVLDVLETSTTFLKATKSDHVNPEAVFHHLLPFHLGVNGCYLLVKPFSIGWMFFHSSGSGMECQGCEAAMKKESQKQVSNHAWYTCCVLKNGGQPHKYDFPDHILKALRIFK